MQVKIISLAFSAATGGFDDAEVRDFIKDKEVISIRDHVFVRNEVPFLTLVIKYFSKATELKSISTFPPPRKKTSGSSYCQNLIWGSLIS